MLPKNIYHGRFFSLKTTNKVSANNIGAIGAVNIVQAKGSLFIHESYPCK